MLNIDVLADYFFTNNGALKTMDLKLQDMKMVDQIAGHKNDGLSCMA